jgi:glycosyltransferase involved in cell wall biosynthesis
MFQENSRLIRLVRGSLKKAYKACDLIADLGPCMAQLLSRYQSQAKTTTLVPWALVEPNEPVTVDPNTRKELFGEAQLALLYSGSYGRAHSCAEFLELARHLKPNTDIQFNFAARGNRIEELKSQVTSDDSNVHFAGFAPESQLEKRLGSCDIHMVSLRPEWTGTVVPSKFFGALATGRSVLFSGSPNSAIAKWIEEFKVGWVLSKENIKEVADQLNRLASSPEQLLQMNRHCHQIYQTHFSKDHLLNRWDQELRELL